MSSQSLSSGYLPDQSPTPPQFLLLSKMLYEMSLWSVQVICTRFVPCMLLVHPSLLAEGTRWETEKALVLRKHCSAIAG